MTYLGKKEGEDAAKLKKRKKSACSPVGRMKKKATDTKSGGQERSSGGVGSPDLVTKGFGSYRTWSGERIRGRKKGEPTFKCVDPAG